MKASFQLTPDMVMKIIAVLFFTITVTYSVMSFINFQTTYESRSEARKMLDIAEAVLADRCLIKDRGMFDYQKLSNQPCVDIPSNYEVSIEDNKGNRYLSGFIPSYGFGFREDELVAVSYPCTIHKSDNNIVPCKLTVWRLV